MWLQEWYYFQQVASEAIVVFLDFSYFHNFSWNIGWPISFLEQCNKEILLLMSLSMLPLHPWGCIYCIYVCRNVLANIFILIELRRYKYSASKVSLFKSRVIFRIVLTSLISSIYSLSKHNLHLLGLLLTNIRKNDFNCLSRQWII